MEDVWGVGQRTAKALRIHGINTAQQLRQARPGWIKQQFGVVMLRTVLELQGFSCLPLEQCPLPKQSITCSRSFGYGVDSLADIKEAVATYTSRAGERLRQELQAATAIVVFIATNRYSDTPQYSNSVTVQLPVATDDTLELVHYALAGVVTIYRAGYQYKKAGVILLGLVSIGIV